VVIVRYIASLPASKVVLWCYLIWYLVVAAHYFDPSLAIWLNAVGISAVIGTALWLGVRSPSGGNASAWQVFRLYLTPFCVSSFSSLIKGRGFILIFPPALPVFGAAVAGCVAFVLVVLLFKAAWRETP
jgi:hypothetical protein